MSFEMEEYAKLAGGGYESFEPVAPEDEFFHSVYISGKTRKNHINITEQAGLLQVRGVEYNLSVVNMIITNVKEVLSKEVKDGNKTRQVCFSFKDTNPWKGSCGKECPLTSAQRSADSYCNQCRAQIIVSGIYCDSSGKPITDAERKPIFIFIRGKGVKYSNVSGYLGDMYKKDLPPIFTPETPASKQFEKAVVNNKRFVTTIDMGTAPSSHGDKDVFVLKEGVQLQDKVVKDILQLAKKTMDKFNEKFDWSLRLGRKNIPQSKPAEGIVSFDEANELAKDKNSNQPSSQEASQESPSGDDDFFNFDDLDMSV